MNLQNDPRLKNMHPLKREILLRLSNSQSTMTPEQMLPNQPKHTENDKDNIKER